MKKVLIMAIIAAFAVAMIAPAAMAKEDNELRLAYVEWSCATAATNVVKTVLEDEMGYEVEIIPVSAAAMWQALSGGDVDGIVCAWLPVTQGHYLERFREDVIDLGPNTEGAGIGLVVPSYVDIDSIADMNEVADKFDGEIIGIDPGAGVMIKTEKVLEAYGLEDIELIEGSGAIMTATLKDRIDDGEWVAVTGWTPHWMFARWDLKYLEDPKGVYGESEAINTVVRKELKEEHPEVFAFLDNFEWSLAEIGQVMDWNASGSDPEESAERWLEENPERLAAWLGK